VTATFFCRPATIAKAKEVWSNLPLDVVAE
jgi:hypothetical protein